VVEHSAKHRERITNQVGDSFWSPGGEKGESGERKEREGGSNMWIANIEKEKKREDVPRQIHLKKVRKKRNLRKASRNGGPELDEPNKLWKKKTLNVNCGRKKKKGDQGKKNQISFRLGGIKRRIERKKKKAH